MIEIAEPANPTASPAGIPTAVADAPVAATENNVMRVDQLNYRDFVNDFQRARRPVIMTDATRDWSALQWTPERLVQRVGHRQLEIRTESGTQSREFAELADEICASQPGQPGPYARNVDLKRDLPELWPDVQPRLKYATPDWKSSRFLPRDFVFPNGLEEMFFGGCGMSFPRLHIDYWGMDGFVSQLYGRKEFILLGQEQTPFVYPVADDPLASQIQDIDNVDLKSVSVV